MESCLEHSGVLAKQDEILKKLDEVQVDVRSLLETRARMRGAILATGAISSGLGAGTALLAKWLAS